jgi:hypothetical protein
MLHFYVIFYHICRRTVEQTSTHNGSSSKVSIEQAMSDEMTNENSAFIHILLFILAEVKAKSDGIRPKKLEALFDMLYYTDEQ